MHSSWYDIGAEFARYGRQRVSGTGLNATEQQDFDDGYCDELERNA